MTGVSGVKSRKLWEVMDWITVTNHADIEFIVVVNEKFWQGLTGAQRDIVTTAARNAEAHVRDEMANIEAEAYAAAEKAGMKVQTLSDADIDAWRQATRPVLDSYLKESGPLGAQIYKAAQDLK